MRSKTAICDKFVAAKLNIMGKIEHLYKRKKQRPSQAVA